MHQSSIIKSTTYTLAFFLALISFVAISLLFFTGRQNVAAAPVTGFNAGKIIDDSVFTNSVSMNVSDIQAFLNAKVPVCDTQGTQVSEYGGGTRAQYAANASLHPATGAFYPPFTCLKDYTENGVSAAQIIYNLSRQYQINPQVFIVLLQKEQSLVTDTWPSPGQYNTATGYGCPDTTGCESQYYGLTNQLTWSAKMFRAILNNSPGWYTPYNLGDNYIRWNPEASCGGSNVFIQNRSTQALYNYTPYQPNASALNAGYGTGDACGAYGNRNFYLYFRDWFGYNSGPAAFKTANSPTVYIPIEGYKMAVPSMALLNDYGISADSIQIVDQAYIDARPTPPGSTQYSNTVSYVVKSPDDTDEDGGSVYLISRGQRYQFQSMQQFYNYGFTESDIAYLPLGYIFTKPDAGPALSYVTSPSHEVFTVDSTGKHMFFQYSTYIAQNPTDKVTSLSYFLADHIKSANPVTTGPVLVKYADSSAVYVYQNNNYYLIPDYTTYSQCWGFDRILNMPIYTPSINSYLKPILSAQDLSCAVTDGTTSFLLNGNSKYTIPDGYPLSATNVNADLMALADKLPTKPRQLSIYVKSASDASVWKLDTGKKYLIPNYANFVALELKDGDIDIINDKTITTFVSSGIKLADGALVKTGTSPAVYLITGGERILYPSGEIFSAYKNNWGDIETYSQAQLDANYPFNNKIIGEYLVDTAKTKAYIIGQSTCYEMASATLAAFGVSYNSLLAAQPYSPAIFKNYSTNGCGVASAFIKLPNSSLVYWVDAGKKYPLNSYAAMTSKNGGQTPIIMEVSNGMIQSLTTGSVIN